MKEEINTSMTRDEILATLQRIEVETKIAVWLFQIDKKYYQVVEYGGVFRVPDATSVWETNKRGKRLSSTELITINGKKHVECVEKFMTQLGITE